MVFHQIWSSNWDGQAWTTGYMALMKSTLGDSGRHIRETTIYPEKQGDRGHVTANQKRDAMDQESKQKFQIWALNRKLKEQILYVTGSDLP